MTIEMMYSNLCEIWIKFEAVTSNNVFGISRPPGGAVKGRCEKCRAIFFQCLYGEHIQSFTLSGGVIGVNTNWPVIAPP